MLEHTVDQQDAVADSALPVTLPSVRKDQEPLASLSASSESVEAETASLTGPFL